jgi:23S rRNA (guanosine2251-2'-O)-methyltransferase
LFVYGRNVIREIIDGNKREIHEIHMIDRIKEAGDILTAAKAKNIKVIFETREKLNKFTGTEKNQGIAAVIDDVTTVSLEEFLCTHNDEKMTIAILDEIEDPHNFGAIIRSCEVLGVCGIIIPSRRSAPINDTVFKTSSGAIDLIDIIEVVNVNQAMEVLKKNGFWIYGMDMSGDKFLDEVEFDRKTAVVLGNEGSGVRALVKKHCDFMVKIRQAGKLDSLNVSNAAAIVFYQVMQQRIK